MRVGRIHALLMFTGLAVLPVCAATESDFIYLPAEEVPFKSPLGVGPQQAVIFGDPSKPGVYVVRIKFPPGFHSNPHYHSQDRHAVVIKGIWWNGTGEELDFNKAKPIAAGSYVYHPAGGIHWDGAGTEEAILQITGIGPVQTTPVGTAPDPARTHWPLPKQP